MGYDPSEPSDSPYGISCTDIMDDIEEISRARVAEFMEDK